MTKKQTMLQKFGRRILSIDQFGEQPGFTIDGQDSYPSCLGATLSLIIIILTLAYGTDKYFTMKDYNNTTFETVVELIEDDPDTRYKFDITNLNVAYIIIDQTNGLPIPQSEFGKYIWPEAQQLKLEPAVSKQQDKITPLKMRACNENDINEKFFEP